MGIAFNTKKLAGAAFNGAKVAGIAYNGQIVWRSGPTWVDTVVYSTDWDEYSAGVDIGAQSGWSRAHTISSRQVETFNQGGGDIAVRASGTGSNNRCWRTNETLPRATTYAKATFTALRNATETYSGVTFHGTGSGAHNFAGFSWNGSQWRLYTGLVSGTVTTDSISLDNSSGHAIPTQTGPWTVEIRATSSTTVDVYVNDEFILTQTTAGSEERCGIIMRNATTAVGTYFEFGTYQ